MVLWAMFGHEFEKAEQCGWCYGCMTKQEIDEDTEKYRREHMELEELKRPF